ncbi:MAG: ATP-grasp domain-containing protein [Sedimentisphaerales bacterium]|nr:ATP-grasp domain-containing protein [Sedimentisphaerales bacterium]
MTDPVQNNDDIKIVPLSPEHARAVAELHISGIKTGFISSLGVEFVTALYEAIAKSNYGYGFVVLKHGKVAGFAAFATHLTGLYKSVIFKHGPRFIFSLARKILSLGTAKKVLETLFYPARVKNMNLPEAEFLSMVISEQARRKGLATDFIKMGFAEAANRGIEKLKILAAVDILPINKLYEKLGFELVGRIENHGIISNVYVVRTDYFCSDTQLKTENTVKPNLGQSPFIAGSRSETENLYSVLVTYGWCRTTYAVVLSLGRRGIDVHVCDASSTAMSRYSRHCKSFTKVPDLFTEPGNYFEAICKALEKTGAKVLLPAHEDVGIFCRRAKELPKGVLTALPPWDSYRIAEDKSHVLDIASRVGCPTPLTLSVHSYSHLEELSRSLVWPVVLKTHIGNSAKGVRIAKNSNELLTKYKDLVKTFHLQNDRWPLLQEFLPGEAAGVCVLYNNGKCVANFAEQYLRCKEPGLFGTSTLRVPLDNPKLISQATAVMDKLKWHGVAHLDFVADKYGEFKLIEVNPRLWGALALSVFSGVDFPYLWYLTATGNAPNEQIPSKYPAIKCRWIAGDYLAFIELVKRRMFKEAAGVLVPQRNCYHDDFVLTDPLPFMFEIFDYALKFLRSGGSTNPVVEGMVR